ncbi:MAG TPA: toll/interleukin-1 receptor domain-containing protein [Allosphingosinicella sp.]|jgi:hypothetical protein|uniref:toll/interleukin-1 receptor domain-containing protein n=1 Tax=Allosphingosinicella sp. TaxID=2823234 RepID=UPI002F273B1A
MQLRRAEKEEIKGAAAPIRFRAFVSYSHADAGFASKLQKQLETYRIPDRLRSRVAPLSGAEGRVGPVFRDRDDFPASADLSQAVRQAIAQSQALLVLCSPGAARSCWVAREIELFRQLHPDGPILAAIIAGDPDEAIPAPLRANGVEPLAADFRPIGDGYRLAFLKMVAGILGVPLDELIQRDAQRRQRRVMGITVAALAAMLVLATMTLFAISARREAERQRAEAEGLVEYMLTDLRQRLKAVGSLDVMTDVNRRAMTYYEEQGAPDALPDDSLERRARVIGAMGEDAENGGHLDLAQSRYAALHRTTEALLAKRKNDPTRIFAHAQSENRLALLALTRERSQEATARFARTQRLLESIASWGHSRPDWLRLVGYAYGNMCATMVKNGGGGARVLSNCERAVQASERLLARRPDDASLLYDLIFHCLWLAEAQLSSGERAQSRRMQGRYLHLSQALVQRDPGNMLWLEQQMEVYVRHADLLWRQGEHDLAGQFLADARRINDRLIARDPSNAFWSAYKERISRELREKGYGRRLDYKVS